MIQKLKFLIVLVMFPLCMKANETDNGYKIDSWIYEAQVHENGVWSIKETMKVTFLEERHGIYRYIPRYWAQSYNVNGTTATYHYHNEIRDVRVGSEEFTLSDGGDSQDNLIIKIGSADRTLTGEHTYIISYDVAVPDDRYDVSDILYLSVLGADCNTTIDELCFNVKFDKPLPEGTASALRTYSGPWGSQGNDLDVAVHVDRTSISGRVIDIAPFNGITLRAEIKDGYWEDAHSESPIQYYVYLFLASVMLTIVAVFFIRNSRSKPLMVIEYNAPDDISSAEVGVIIDNTADLSDLTSLIVWFASKGYVKIREIEGKKHLLRKDEMDIELTILKSLPDGCPDYMKEFWKVLFGNDGNTVLLSQLGDKHVGIQKALLSLQKYFSGKRSLYSTSIKSILAITGFFLSGIAVLNASSSITSVDGDMLLFATILWAGPTLFLSLIRVALSNYDMINKFRWRMLQYICIIVAGAVDILMFKYSFYNENDSFASFEILAGLVGAGWLITLFSARINRDSKFRMEKMSLLLGFREFIEKSELPMLKAQVDENPSYFYDVLPYAMVFGLTDKWVKKFKEIDIQNPDWYEGTGNMSSFMLANHLSHSVSDNIRSSIQASSHDTTSASSSSSGGGFSGGGVGGGGCGSW